MDVATATIAVGGEQCCELGFTGGGGGSGGIAFGVGGREGSLIRVCNCVLAGTSKSGLSRVCERVALRFGSKGGGRCAWDRVLGVRGG